MQSNIIGINDESLKKLILDIYDCRDKISKILEDAEIIAESTNLFYKTADGEEFRNQFKKLSANFPVFINNIKSYGEDLEQVLFKYKEISKNAVDIFEK